MRSADYGLKNFDLGDEDVRGTMIAESKELLDVAKDYLERGNAEDEAQKS